MQGALVSLPGLVERDASLAQPLSHACGQELAELLGCTQPTLRQPALATLLSVLVADRAGCAATLAGRGCVVAAARALRLGLPEPAAGVRLLRLLVMDSAGRAMELAGLGIVPQLVALAGEGEQEEELREEVAAALQVVQAALVAAPGLAWARASEEWKLEERAALLWTT